MILIDPNAFWFIRAYSLIFFCTRSPSVPQEISHLTKFSDEPIYLVRGVTRNAVN